VHYKLVDDDSDDLLKQIMQPYLGIFVTLPSMHMNSVIHFLVSREWYTHHLNEVSIILPDLSFILCSLTFFQLYFLQLPSPTSFYVLGLRLSCKKNFCTIVWLCSLQSFLM